MAQNRYYLVDSSKNLKTIALIDRRRVHQVIRQETEKPTVALSERAMKKAIAAGWW